VSLLALLSMAVPAIVIAVQTSLACTDKLALAMPDGVMAAMPGMDTGYHSVLICPVVLALIGASALLTAAAGGMLWNDPHRAATQRAIVRALAHLPPAPTAGALALAGGTAVAAMLWLERSTPPALPICALLVALLLVCSLSAALFGIVAGRIALALGRRLILAIVTAVAAAGAATPATLRVVPVVAGGHAVPLLSSGRGLRAPPSRVR
jgi:hypothetical protein